MYLLYITWNPDSMIIDLGFFAIRWYSLLFGLGFVLAYFILKHQFKREHVEIEKLDKLTIYVALATFIGARLGHVLFYDFDYYSRHIAEIFLPFSFDPEFRFTGFQGLASHGAAIGILIALLLFSRKYKLSLFWLLDKLALVVPLAGALIRLGNLMNSEIIGKPATVEWAFVFVKVDRIPRHPTQLYEAIAYLIIFCILLLANRRSNMRAGRIFGLFLILLFSVRFFLEFLKADQSDFEAGMILNMGQILSIPFIVAGAVIIAKSSKAKRLE